MTPDLKLGAGESAGLMMASSAWVADVRDLLARTLLAETERGAETPSEMELRAAPLFSVNLREKILLYKETRTGHMSHACVSRSSRATTHLRSLPFYNLFLLFASSVTSRCGSESCHDVIAVMATLSSEACLLFSISYLSSDVVLKTTLENQLCSFYLKCASL